MIDTKKAREICDAATAALLCFFKHKWRETHRSYRALYMAAFHPMAGSRFECDRCGKVWDDLPYGSMIDPNTGAIVTGPHELTGSVGDRT